MNKKPLMLVALLCALPTLNALAKSEPQNVLTLKQALKNTEQKNLQLKRYPYHQKILTALKSQAALSPNPELSFEAENFLGTHGSHAFSGAQYTLALSQLIELGDKRQNRINYATANIKAQTIEYKNTRLALLATTAERYYQVLKFQALIALNSERKNTVKQALNVIEKRAKAGAVSSADVTRMRYALSQVDLNTAMLQSEFERSRLALNELWQEVKVSDYYAGDLSQIAAIKSEAALLDMINTAPEFALLQQQYMQKTANLALQRSSGQSDLTLGGGVRYNQQTDASSFVFSFSMPLQLSNANGGNIEAAQHQLALLNEQQGQLRIQLRKQIRTLYAYYQGKSTQAQLLTQRVIPQAQTLIKQSLKSYQQGQISVLQLLDAQQALFDSKRALINTHSELYQVLLTLERLTGQPLIETHQS
ncbi:TolC family protein [Pseudoalteromonas carrageenovora]|uniref:TolC family protein n=1 Tax=Pseudoalteromonas carrageenovora TaxID=227 RepID=UPI002117EFF5|nr:TolC family protein [Pseudoalteromonas carrageenovora]MCQ8889220.1 TolC family protein [Pseudoalteromonas carrageenovora]